MNKVLSQQQQIDELRARLEALEEKSQWMSLAAAAPIVGLSPPTMRARSQLRAYKKAFRRRGNKYQVHVGLFQKQLDKEQYVQA